jgi:hypothetical protein
MLSCATISTRLTVRAIASEKIRNDFLRIELGMGAMRCEKPAGRCLNKNASAAKLVAARL